MIIQKWSTTSMLAALWVAPIAWIFLKSPKLSHFRCKPLEEIGKASYNIFLVQMIFSWHRNVVRGIVPGEVLQTIIFFGVSIVGGYIFYLVESRITKAVSQSLKEHDYYVGSIHKMLEKIEAVMTK